MSAHDELLYALQLCVTELLHDGVPTDPVHPRRVALDLAEKALVNSGYTAHGVADEMVAWQRRDRISHGGGQPDGWSHWREVGRHEFDQHHGKLVHIQYRGLYADPPSAQPRAAGVPNDAELLRDLRQFHEETEACSEFDLPNQAIAALLVANLIEGTHYMLTKKGEGMLVAATTAEKRG